MVSIFILWKFIQTQIISCAHQKKTKCIEKNSQCSVLINANSIKESKTHSVDATELQRNEDDDNGEELPVNCLVLN